MINCVILVGRLTADPEIRYTQSGIPVANFSIAVERNFKNSAGERETDFINIVAWRKTAELMAEYTKKGHMIGVDGTLQMRKYQTKEGENRTVYEVQADSIQFLERGTGARAAGQPVPPPSDSNAPGGGGFPREVDEPPPQTQFPL